MPYLARSGHAVALIHSAADTLAVTDRVPHGIHVEYDGTCEANDRVGGGAKGHAVHKFSQEGRLLMTLGQPGVAGAGPDEFNAPSAVFVARNGDFFVGDGDGGNTNARIVK